MLQRIKKNMRWKTAVYKKEKKNCSSNLISRAARLINGNKVFRIGMTLLLVSNKFLKTLDSYRCIQSVAPNLKLSFRNFLALRVSSRHSE